MPELKKARKVLYEVMETGSREQIVEASQEVDKLVLRLMHKQIRKKQL